MLRRRRVRSCPPAEGREELGMLWRQKESNFQSLEPLNHSYNPGCHSEMLCDTYTKPPATELKTGG